MLNAKQFDALATLLRMRPGATRDAAHAVMVKGLSVADAARGVIGKVVPGADAADTLKQGGGQ